MYEFAMLTTQKDENKLFSLSDNESALLLGLFKILDISRLSELAKEVYAVLQDHSKLSDQLLQAQIQIVEQRFIIDDQSNQLTNKPLEIGKKRKLSPPQHESTIPNNLSAYSGAPFQTPAILPNLPCQNTSKNDFREVKIQQNPSISVACQAKPPIKVTRSACTQTEIEKRPEPEPPAFTDKSTASSCPIQWLGDMIKYIPAIQSVIYTQSRDKEHGLYFCLATLVKVDETKVLFHGSGPSPTTARKAAAVYTILYLMDQKCFKPEDVVLPNLTKWIKLCSDYSALLARSHAYNIFTGDVCFDQFMKENDLKLWQSTDSTSDNLPSDRLFTKKLSIVLSQVRYEATSSATSDFSSLRLAKLDLLSQLIADNHIPAPNPEKSIKRETAELGTMTENSTMNSEATPDLVESTSLPESQDSEYMPPTPTRVGKPSTWSPKPWRQVSPAETVGDENRNRPYGSTGSVFQRLGADQAVRPPSWLTPFPSERQQTLSTYAAQAPSRVESGWQRLSQKEPEIRPMPVSYVPRAMAPLNVFSDFSSQHSNNSTQNPLLSQNNVGPYNPPVLQLDPRAHAQNQQHEQIGLESGPRQLNLGTPEQSDWSDTDSQKTITQNDVSKGASLLSDKQKAVSPWNQTDQSKDNSRAEDWGIDWSMDNRRTASSVKWTIARKNVETVSKTITTAKLTTQNNAKITADSLKTRGNVASAAKSGKPSSNITIRKVPPKSTSQSTQITKAIAKNIQKPTVSTKPTAEPSKKSKSKTVITSRAETPLSANPFANFKAKKKPKNTTQEADRPKRTRNPSKSIKQIVYLDVPCERVSLDDSNLDSLMNDHKKRRSNSPDESIRRSSRIAAKGVQIASPQRTPKRRKVSSPQKKNDKSIVVAIEPIDKNPPAIKETGEDFNAKLERLRAQKKLRLRNRTDVKK